MAGAVPQLGEMEGMCEGCIKGRQEQSIKVDSPFHKRAEWPMQRWHVDLVVVNNCGPYRYGMIITDEYSGFAMFTPLISKGSAFEKFKESWLMMEKQTGKELEEVQSDQDKEFINKPMNEWLKSKGIKCRKSVAYSHEQNGLAEQSNCTTLEKGTVNIWHQQTYPKNYGQKQ